MKSIFLCHSSKDKHFARELKKRLGEFDVKTWIDEAEIKIGDSLLMKISQGIKDTDYVAAILSKNSVTSDWVQKELSMAMYKEINGKKIVVLPLLIDECQIPFFLKDKLYADFTNPANFDSSFSKLLEVIGIEQKVGGDFIQTSSTPTIQTTDLVTDETESKEIKIIGADKKKTYKPDEREILYNVYFKLSDYPPEEWVSIFETERRFPRHTMWRKAWIEDEGKRNSRAQANK